MTSTPPLGSMTVADLLAAIASDEPAPGAGAAGAVALALGLACARKALHISARHHRADASVPLLDARLATIGKAALEDGRLDAQHFRALIEAMRLPHDDAVGTAARTAAIDDAKARVRSTTGRLLAQCDDAAAEFDAVARHADPVMAGDVSAARALVGAARAIQAANLADGDRHGI